MSRRNTPYYDDENIQTMSGEYTIVDYTQPTGSDYNSPNTDKSVAIVSEAPKYSVQETSVFIEKTMGPVLVARDQQLEVLNLIEAGELVSIELVTDNPYISLYLEMDDYKYKAPNGMTAAELLLRGREEFAERHFYAVGPRPDGMYVVKFHPRSDRKYSDRIKILVRNDITRPKKFRGRQFSFENRGSLPTPTTLGFNGGSILNVPNSSAINAQALRAVLGPVIARGIGVEERGNPLTNDKFRTTPLLLAGASHPFVGNAGKVPHQNIDLTMPGGIATRIVWGAPGTAATSSTVDDSALLTNTYPGNAENGSGSARHSSQQFIIYTDNTEVESVVGGEAMVIIYNELSTILNDQVPLWFNIGDNVYYPGEIIGLHKYDIAQTKYVSEAVVPGYNPVEFGAVLVTVSPGFDITPPKLDGAHDGNDSMGYLLVNQMNYEAIVHEVNVKRKKTRQLN